jgi:hypothetical protein
VRQVGGNAASAVVQHLDVPAGYRVQASPGVDDLTPVAMLSDGSDKSSHQPVGVAVRL